MSIQLHILRDANYGPVLTTQIRWNLARYEQTAHDQQWPAAADALERICATLASAKTTTSSQTWQVLLTALTHATLHAKRPENFRQALETFSHRAFPDNTQPYALAAAFTDIHDPDRFACATQFGEILAGTYPNCPLGFYLIADFNERAGAKVRNRPAVEINQIVQNYQTAIRLGDAAELTQFTQICQLRLGAFLLTTGTDRDTGRQILKTITADTLTPNDALWYARAMLHSTFWLDRVRTADILDNLAQANTQTHNNLDKNLIQETARALLHASPFELQPAEHDRLTALAETLFPGPQASEWHQLLELRPALQTLQNQRLDQSEDAFILLNQLARNQSDPTQPDTTQHSPWQDTFHSFARLQAAFVQHTDSTPTLPQHALQRPADTHRYRFAELTGDLLDALAANNYPKINELLRTLHTTLRRLDDAHDTMELKPVALLWPHLLPHANQLSPDAPLQDAALAWTTRTPAPSYGFWLLAAHFLRANLFAAARTAATRALSDASPAPQHLRRHVLGHLTDHAINTRDPDAMLTWLTHFKSFN